MGLYRVSGLFSVAAGTFVAGVPYTIKVTRENNGNFTVYAKGLNFIPNTLYDGFTKLTPNNGTNPIIDNTYTTNSYFKVNSVGSGGLDIFGNLKITDGIKQ